MAAGARGELPPLPDALTSKRRAATLPVARADPRPRGTRRVRTLEGSPSVGDAEEMRCHPARADPTRASQPTLLPVRYDGRRSVGGRRWRPSATSREPAALSARMPRVPLTASPTSARRPGAGVLERCKAQFAYRDRAGSVRRRTASIIPIADELTEARSREVSPSQMLRRGRGSAH